MSQWSNKQRISLQLFCSCFISILWTVYEDLEYVHHSRFLKEWLFIVIYCFRAVHKTSESSSDYDFTILIKVVFVNKNIRFSRCFGIWKRFQKTEVCLGHFQRTFNCLRRFLPLVRFFFLRFLSRKSTASWNTTDLNVQSRFEYLKRKWRNKVFVVRGTSPFWRASWWKMAFSGNWPTPFSRHSQKKRCFAGQSHRSSHFCWPKCWNFRFSLQFGVQSVLKEQKSRTILTKEKSMRRLSLRYKKRDLTMSRAEDIIGCEKRETQIKNLRYAKLEWKRLIFSGRKSRTRQRKKTSEMRM